jgi:hypothetical protein
MSVCPCHPLASRLSIVCFQGHLHSKSSCGGKLYGGWLPGADITSQPASQPGFCLLSESTYQPISPARRRRIGPRLRYAFLITLNETKRNETT